MPAPCVDQIVRSVLRSKQAFCKFLSANDTGATGAHQVGILVSKSAKNILFSQDLEGESILKRIVQIKWQDDFITESCFTYYASKNELRITRFGKGFPFLKAEQTGSLFVFTKQQEDHYCGFFLDTEEDIESFLSALGISPTETNRLIDTSQVSPTTKENIAIFEFIRQLNVDFPTSREMSGAARNIYNQVYDYKESIYTNADQQIIEWTRMEYALFRALEYSRYSSTISRGFASVDDFVNMANMVLNRRKSRAGKSLEHHLSAIFDDNNLCYSAQAITEGNKKPDFIFPSQEAYHDKEYPVDNLISLAAKTTCKDRWRQIINEADRLRDKPKFLFTLQQGISPAQMDEMDSENIILVVPKPYISSYPKDRQHKIWSLRKFIGYVQTIEGVK